VATSEPLRLPLAVLFNTHFFRVTHKLGWVPQTAVFRNCRIFTG